MCVETLKEQYVITKLRNIKNTSKQHNTPKMSHIGLVGCFKKILTYFHFRLFSVLPYK